MIYNRFHTQPPPNNSTFYFYYHSTNIDQLEHSTYLSRAHFRQVARDSQIRDCWNVRSFLTSRFHDSPVSDQCLPYGVMFFCIRKHIDLYPCAHFFTVSLHQRFTMIQMDWQDKHLYEPHNSPFWRKWKILNLLHVCSRAPVKSRWSTDRQIPQQQFHSEQKTDNSQQIHNVGKNSPVQSSSELPVVRQ